MTYTIGTASGKIIFEEGTDTRVTALRAGDVSVDVPVRRHSKAVFDTRLD